MKSQIKAGMLVRRGSLMFLVVQVGRDYQEGLALCQQLKPNPEEFWIMKSLLRPV
jgi:hypothetical protein